MLAFAFFLFSSRATVPAATSRLKAGDWSIEMGTSGSVSSFLFDGQVVGHAIGRPPVSLALGNQEIRPELEGAVELIRGGIRCRLVARTQPWVDLVVTTTFRKEAGLVVLRRELEISAAGKLLEDLTVRLPQLPFEFTEKTWLPLKDGRGVDFGAQRQAVYRFSGAAPATGHRLALPLMTFQASEPWGRVTVIADPYFSTVFKRDTVEWTYPKAIGLADPVEKRSVATVFQKGPPDAALDAFFALAVPEIEKGPDWLRDIAMVDYDYMSDAGTGWSRDLAALAAALPRGDRGQVLCCLHGWYDWVGRYSLDRKTHRFDPAWANFGAYERVKDNHATMKRGNVDVDIGFAKCVPTRLTAGMIRGRLAEAKAKGFRTAIYFADGMNAGDGLPDFSTNKVLRWGGWGGPDISGKTYVMNPLHPDVAPLFHELMSVVLSEFGDEVDALVWDETFHVGAGDLGTSSYPGYADRAMMRLTRDLTLQVQDYNRRHGRKIAFLASDAIGPTAAADAPPYAIMAHGTYQDSHCDPGAWSYGIFPNYRNVLWSCCWWPVSKWNWVEYGVRTFFAPVAISNGWGDNLGFGEMTPEQRGRVLQLFEWRKSHRGYPHWLYTLPILLPELGK
jgi:hypothetical protein